MSDRTSGNNFVCTTSSLQTEDITDKMIKTLGKKNPLEYSMDFSLQTLPLLLFLKVMQKNESKALDVFIHNNGELTDLLASLLVCFFVFVFFV